MFPLKTSDFYRTVSSSLEIVLCSAFQDLGNFESSSKRTFTLFFVPQYFDSSGPEFRSPIKIQINHTKNKIKILSVENNNQLKQLVRRTRVF